MGLLDMLLPGRFRRFNRYKPHQGFRERARRIGGDTWAQYKQWDRERRGLPQFKEPNA